MESVGTTLLSEVHRFGDVSSTLVIGDIEDELLAELPGTIHRQSVSDILDQDKDGSSRFDLVVSVDHGEKDEIALRTLGLAIATIASRGVIVIHPLGEELPIPLVELKRGLPLDSPELGYRVYGVREVQK